MVLRPSHYPTAWCAGDCRPDHAIAPARAAVTPGHALMFPRMVGVWPQRCSHELDQERFARRNGLSSVEDTTTQDLVCRMEAGGDSRFFSDYGGKLYYFCSPECKRKFDDHPDQFIQQKAREETGLAPQPS